MRTHPITGTRTLTNAPRRRMNSPATLPNLLTILRLLLAPFIFTAIVTGPHKRALVLFVIAALTDGLDGLLARRINQSTALGAYLDPIADKVLLSGVFLSLAIAGSIPSWLVVVIFGRDLLLLASSGIALLFTAFREFRPSLWGKASTFVQIACATVWMAQNAVDLPWLHTLATSIIWPSAAITIWSGLHYSWRGFRFLKAH
jgi:cardiolipin synthase (CMP-forming)